MNIVRREGSSLPTYRPASFDDAFGRMFENMFEDFFAPFTPYSFLLSKCDGSTVLSLPKKESSQAKELTIQQQP